MTIYAIILAAGSARRMGQPKQLLDWGGVPLVRVVAQQALASPLAGVYVVTGHAGAQVSAALADLPVTCVENVDYAAGQSTSLRAGIVALPTNASGALVLLGDQPFVTTAVITTILQAWHATPARIAAPVYAGTRGHPVLFDAALFPTLCAITGDQGARDLLRAHAADTLLVPFTDATPLADLDTPEEYTRLKPSDLAS